MLNSTPESVAAHLRDLADKPPKAGPELMARCRHERRLRLRRVAVSVLRVLPFVRLRTDGEVTPIEPGPAT